MFVINGRPWPLASSLDLMAVLGERCSLPAVATAFDASSFDCALRGEDDDLDGRATIAVDGRVKQST